MAKGDTKTNQYLDIAANGTRADLPADTCCETRTQTLIRGVAERVMDVEDEVEEIKNNPDVVDIVPTYAALQNYDTSGLTDKDIIRVLADETHDGASTYYRYSTATGTFTYIGKVGSYYTEDEVDALLAEKQDNLIAGANIQIAADGKTISATDTTYTAGAGIDITNNVISATSTGPTVVQTTGTSTTSVMSQNATTSMVYDDPSTRTRVKIGVSSDATGYSAVAVGQDASATGSTSIAFAGGATSTKGVVQMGLNATPGWGTYGYNDSQYRLLSGLYDGQNDHDAVTVGQLNTRLGGLTLVSISQTDYDNLQTKDANTLYVITGA